MKKPMFMAAPIALGLCGVLAWPSVAQPKNGQTKTSNLSAQDRKFARAAAEGGMAEVRLGELANKQAASEGVKDFGQRMVTDHGKANDELKQWAAKEGFTLPRGIGSKNEATYSKLAKLNGTSFDRAYMKDMVKDHKADIADFQKEAAKGYDPELKSWASKTLPTLQEHLSMAMNLNNPMNGKMHRSRMQAK